MSLLILYLLLALGVSFLCSLLEAALLSVPESHVAVMVREKRMGGLTLERMKHSIDRPLAAILTLNTIAHTIGAAGVGAQVHTLWGKSAVTAASVVLTLLILILSEIIPKTLGAVHCKRLAPFTAYTIKLLIWICYPLVLFCELLGQLLTGGSHAHQLTREEIASVADIGERQGTLLGEESRVIRNLLRLKDIRVQDIMTPRPVVFGARGTLTVGDAVDPGNPLRFSRFPVYGRNEDDVIGVVHRYQVLDEMGKGNTDRPLAQLAQPIHTLPESCPVADALDQFIQRQEHLFLVVDEYGGTAGIVTLEDAIETLLGVEIVDETDSVENMRELARQRWQERHRDPT